MVVRGKITGFIYSILILAGIFPLYGNDWAFTGIIPNGHRGSVNALVHKGNVILSAGEDGFLEIWNIPVGSRSGGMAVERFQVSPYSIIAMAERPQTDEVCLVESDGMGLCRVSAWNYKERRNIFSLRLRDPVSRVFYSMGGKFIIAARTGRTGLVFIDSVTGAALQSPQSLTGAVSLAVTGRSERNMLVYLTSGALSYWDLESGNETNHFEAPPNLYSPVLFSNNRYFAGLNAEGLAVINAVTGELLERDNSVPNGSLLYPAGDDFFCLVQKENTAVELYRYTINRTGHLDKPGRFSFSTGNDSGRFTVIAANGGGVALGTAAGSLVITGANGQMQTLVTKEQTGIIDADVSGATIAFLAENGTMGFIPLNYSQLFAGRTINIEQNPDAYSRITAFTDPASRELSNGQFVFWQDRNTRTQPLIRSPGYDSAKITLGGVTFRSPIRLVNSFGGKILFLDSMGNISVASPLDTAKSRPFTFFSVGLMDAAFVDPDRLIIGRSAVSGNTPFMMININTGETVPLPYPCQAGVTMYRGASGSIYAAAVSSQMSDNETEGIKTSILQLDTANITGSVKLVDFEGEDTQFSLAESPGGAAGSLAATIGGEGAAIYSNAGIHQLERTAGLPLRLINGGQYLISLDRDGSICWHDSHNGKLLAIFRLHPDGWALHTEQRTINGKLEVVD